jgi:hypothetical protein
LKVIPFSLNSNSHSHFLSDLVAKSRPPEFAELQMQAIYADPKGRNIERKFGDDPFVKNWCSRHNLDVDKCAHFFYNGADSVRLFLEVVGGRVDLQAIFIKGSRTKPRSDKDYITIDDLEAIKPVVTLNKGLKAFSINGHKLEEKHANLIVSCLHSNQAVSLLDLFDNNITTAVAMKLLGDLKEQTNVEELNLGENNIDADGRTTLKNEQERNFPSLRLFL